MKPYFGSIVSLAVGVTADAAAIFVVLGWVPIPAPWLVLLIVFGTVGFLAHVALGIFLVRIGKSYRDLSYLASTDPLTKAFNRREFFKVAEEERDRALRSGTTFGMIVLDLDDFSAINNAHGHYTGDHVLVDVANAIKDILRTYDCFGRVGGEEFAIMLPECNEECSYVTAIRIQHAIEQCSNRRFNVSASIGVAQWNGVEPIADLYQRADDAEREAKQSGKNQVKKSTF